MLALAMFACLLSYSDIYISLMHTGSGWAGLLSEAARKPELRDKLGYFIDMVAGTCTCPDFEFNRCPTFVKNTAKRGSYYVWDFLCKCCIAANFESVQMHMNMLEVLFLSSQAPVQAHLRCAAPCTWVALRAPAAHFVGTTAPAPGCQRPSQECPACLYRA